MATNALYQWGTWSTVKSTPYGYKVAVWYIQDKISYRISVLGWPSWTANILSSMLALFFPAASACTRLYSVFPVQYMTHVFGWFQLAFLKFCKSCSSCFFDITSCAWLIQCRDDPRVQMLFRWLWGMILIWLPTLIQSTVTRFICGGNVGTDRAETLRLTSLTVHVSLLLCLSDVARPALFGSL